MPEQSQDYALVIGINDYPDFGRNGRPLKGAIEDATSFAKWLLNKEIGGGIPDTQCKRLYSSPAPLEPLRYQIDRALKEIWDQAQETGGRRFYFYFSGHGQAQEIDDVALCLANWSRDFRNASLSSRAYRNRILECAPFQDLVVLHDCCRVRSIRATGLGPEIGCARPADMAGARGTFLAYASEFQKPAYEAEHAGGEGVDDEGPIISGHFTEALLAGLYGAASRPQGGVTATELKNILNGKCLVSRWNTSIHSFRKYPHCRQTLTSLFSAAPYQKRITKSDFLQGAVA